MTMRYAPARPLALAATLTALVMVAGCKEEKKNAPAQTAAPSERVREAVERTIRAGATSPDRMQFRGVQVYDQALPQRTAVCGQVSPFVDSPTIFVPFVTVATFDPGRNGQLPQYTFDQHVGTTTAEASRVYMAIVDYCYDKGGPSAGPYRSPMPMPPLPDTIADPGAKPAPATPVAMPSATVAPVTPGLTTTPASGTVTMRQNGNLHTDPHGPTLRVIPKGTSMHVFAQAAGGWYNVGDTAPWGWVHESLLDPR